MSEYPYDQPSYDPPADDPCDCAPAPVEEVPITEPVVPEPVVEEPPVAEPVAVEPPVVEPAPDLTQPAPAPQTPVETPAAPATESTPTGAWTSFSADPGSEAPTGAPTSFSADPGSEGPTGAPTAFSADPASQPVARPGAPSEGPGAVVEFGNQSPFDETGQANYVTASPDAEQLPGPYGQALPGHTTGQLFEMGALRGAFSSGSDSLDPSAPERDRSDWIYNQMHDRATQGYQENGIRYGPDGTPL